MLLASGYRRCWRSMTITRRRRSLVSRTDTAFDFRLHTAQHSYVTSYHLPRLQLVALSGCQVHIVAASVIRVVLAVARGVGSTCAMISRPVGIVLGLLLACVLVLLR
jgi:hypothetical protein